MILQRYLAALGLPATDLRSGRQARSRVDGSVPPPRLAPISPAWRPLPAGRRGRRPRRAIVARRGPPRPRPPPGRRAGARRGAGGPGVGAGGGRGGAPLSGPPRLSPPPGRLPQSASVVGVGAPSEPGDGLLGPLDLPEHLRRLLQGVGVTG